VNVSEIILVIDHEAVRLRLVDLLESEQTYDIRETKDRRFGLAAGLASPVALALFDLMKLAFWGSPCAPSSGLMSGAGRCP
jgi:hypothetical protein